MLQEHMNIYIYIHLKQMKTEQSGQGCKTCIYIYKQGNPSTKSTRHVDANVNMRKENQDHQNSNNEVEDANAKGLVIRHYRHTYAFTTLDCQRVHRGTR